MVIGLLAICVLRVVASHHLSVGLAGLAFGAAMLANSLPFMPHWSDVSSITRPDDTAKAI